MFTKLVKSQNEILEARGYCDLIQNKYIDEGR